MFDIRSVSAQVKYNCNISDARYWGNYSPCGLLLRMRDLYKIENGLKPWDMITHKAIGSWIEKREALWQELEDAEFRDIEIEGKKYRPFDLKGINYALAGQGWFYGAGYGNSFKPVFILGKLSSDRKEGRFRVFVVDRETARDLSTSPAMIQGDTIIARTETMQHFLWGKFDEMKMRKCEGSLHHAFSAYGLSGDADMPAVEKTFPRIVREELRTYIYHELGEASQRRILGRWWKQLLQELPYSRAEIFIRALKDIMSDTCTSGMLNYIMEGGKTGSLSFYVSTLSGYRKILFPEIIHAYHEFMVTGNWAVIRKARAEGYKKAGDLAKRLKTLFDKGMASSEMIERELIPEY